VAQQAAGRTGLDVGILKQMLPLVATLTMEGLSQQSKVSAGSPSSLSGLLTPLLDRDRDGSIVDDVLGAAGKLFGGSR
jgi:hypothetical protein